MSRAGATKSIPVVAIDGPGGVGKGTLMQRLAGVLGWHLLDSGATFRVLALLAQRAGVALNDAHGLVALGDGPDVRFVAADDPASPPRVLLGGVDATAELRSEACGAAASVLAPLAPVRAVLLQMQRGFRRPPGLVADGRDMGTVVFPDATLKLFLDASVSERAKRRYKQLIDKGESANLPALLKELEVRDARDRGRAEAPLRAAEDAVLIDTTALSADAVLEQALALVRERLAASR